MNVVANGQTTVIQIKWTDISKGGGVQIALGVGATISIQLKMDKKEFTELAKQAIDESLVKINELNTKKITDGKCNSILQ